MPDQLRCGIAATALLILCCGCAARSSPPEEPEQTTTTAASTATSVSTESTETTVTTLFQGGIGDERNANTPRPEYFVYRFQTSAVSVRLAGGTYQVLSYDFSQIFETERESIGFYLDDYNTDGAYDLFAPVQYDGDNILAYAVFLWDSGQDKFAEDPIIIETKLDSQ